MRQKEDATAEDQVEVHYVIPLFAFPHGIIENCDDYPIEAVVAAALLFRRRPVERTFLT